MSVIDEIIEDAERLREAPFILNGEQRTVYYRLMTGATHAKVLGLAKKSRTIIQPDGSKLESEYYDDDLIRAYTIFFQMMDEDGNRVFTDMAKDPKIIQDKVPYETSSMLAASMGLRSISDMIEELKKNSKTTA
jgi:hypothetical protein